MNIVADSVEIDSQTGEIKLIGFRGDTDNSEARNLQMRVVVERELVTSDGDPPRRELFASSYFYPVLVNEDGTSVKGLLED